MTKNDENIIMEQVVELLKEVYDPEFPVVDIYTLWLIIDIKIDKTKKSIFILMTLTSPACPMWDLILDMVKNAVLTKFWDYVVDIELTFDVMWNPDMIKDEDIKRMFS